jgi:hypothetical protein
LEIYDKFWRFPVRIVIVIIHKCKISVKRKDLINATMGLRSYTNDKKSEKRKDSINVTE